jgi:flavin reductase (DIM6/NTAB) family NADH-FMN oxidoreductase RutF
MEINPTSMQPHAIHRLLTSSVVPRPIAWVATQNSAGQYNLAPYSFFNAICSNPPAISIASTYTTDNPDHLKDTIRNILTLGEFVVNIVTESNAVIMNETAINYPKEISEFERADLTPEPSLTVRPPRVAESPISFECTLYTTVPIGEGPGSGTLIVGIVQHIYIQDNLLDERGAVDPLRLQPVGKLEGSGYSYVREFFHLERKKYQPED